MTNSPDIDPASDVNDGRLPLVGTSKKDAEMLRTGKGYGFTIPNILALLASPFEKLINRERGDSTNSERHFFSRRRLVAGLIIAGIAISFVFTSSGEDSTSDGGDADAEYAAGPFPYAVQPGDTYGSVAINRLKGTAAEGSQPIAQCFADETRELNDGRSVNDLGEVDGTKLMIIPNLVVREDDGTLKLVYWHFDEEGNPVSDGESPCSAPPPN